jgi:hypothetical protein
VKRAHRVRKPFAGFEFHRGCTGSTPRKPETEKLADWSRKLFSRHPARTLDSLYRVIHLCLLVRFSFAALQASMRRASCLADLEVSN